MLSVYEFRDAGSIGTGTTMIGTDTNPFLSRVPLGSVPVPLFFCLMGTGTTTIWYQYRIAILPKNDRFCHISLTFLQ